MPCTMRSAKSESTSSENTISASEATMLSSPTRISRFRRPRSLQRPANGRRTIGTTLNPPTISPTCHFEPPMWSM